jgi:hypothetical protein
VAVSDKVSMKVKIIDGALVLDVTALGTLILLK